jgi:hypothetical protein
LLHKRSVNQPKPLSFALAAGLNWCYPFADSDGKEFNQMA